MCTLVILRRPGHGWPVVVAANRDEMADRPWQPPGRHWPDRPGIVAGRDVLAGGSWLGLNDDGVVCGVLNRRHSLGPAAGLRSRGDLVLDALSHPDATTAARALRALDPALWRSFNLVVADRRAAFWLYGHGPDGPGEVGVATIPEGVHMVTAWDMDDPESARIRTHLPRFVEAHPPEPDAWPEGDWAEWQMLLASRAGGDGNMQREGAMNIATDTGFGTVSASLIALPAPDTAAAPVWRFCPAAPGAAPWTFVAV